MTDLREPPKSAIQTGYMMNRGVRKFEKYYNQARECLDLATTDVNALVGPDQQVYQHDLAKAKRLMSEAMAGAYKMEQAHHELDRIMNSRGFRQITGEDFLEFGAGGGGR